MPEIQCFMVELVNERQEPAKPQEHPGHLYYDVRRTDTGEIILTGVGWLYESGSHAVPVGSMWFRNVKLIDPEPKPGGRYFAAGEHLMVMTPGGPWTIDARASNCERPDDMRHKCWPRKGRPPAVTVDKTYGETCAAGAGSIQVGAYHGFLRDGKLSDG